MNETPILEELRKYNTHERIYRAIEAADPEKKRHILNNLAQRPGLIQTMWIPDLQMIPPHLLSEAWVFNKGPEHHVVLVKHNRFTPAIAHAHDFYEMIYVLEGGATHEIEGESSTISEGDVVLISPDAQHALDVRDDGLVLDILIRKSAFNARFFDLLGQENMLSSYFRNDLYALRHYTHITFQTGHSKDIQRLMLDMYEESQQEDAYRESILHAMLMILFARLMRQFGNRCFLPKIHGKKNASFDRILTHIQANCARLSLTELAETFHFTPAYLSTLIKEQTGQTYSSICRSIRLGQAKELLKGSNLPVHIIGERVGYASPPHFIRLFQKHVGMSPTCFRHSCKPDG